MPAHEAHILTAKLTILHEDVGEIKQALGKLSDAITKLALVEERQAQTNAAMDRAFKSIEKLEDRIKLMEKGHHDAGRVAKWFDRGLWAAASAAVIFISKKAGLL